MSSERVGARYPHGEQFQIGVIGAGEADAEMKELAMEVGRLVGERGWRLICGGLGGVMEAASRGIYENRGLSVGILPGSSRRHGNPYLGVVLPTGMGQARNVIIAQAADALIAIGGGYGTLSEIALGLKMGKPVISLRSWQPDESVLSVETPEEAVAAVAGVLGEIHPDFGKEGK